MRAVRYRADAPMRHRAFKPARALLAAAVFVAQLLAGSLYAHEVDEALIKEIVGREVERLLVTEGVVDLAVEKGIRNFIRQSRIKNLRPVDPRRDHVLGDPGAAVTLVEYSDFECPFCKHFHLVMNRLMAENRGKLRWVYRHFPLDFHNPGAQKQAEASECVAEINGNDAFWEFADRIYQRTKANGNGFPLENLRPLAEEIGVDGGAFDACMASGRMTDRVQQDHANGASVGVSGTPSSILLNRNGEARFLEGVPRIEVLQEMIDKLAN